MRSAKQSSSGRVFHDRHRGFVTSPVAPAYIAFLAHFVVAARRGAGSVGGPALPLERFLGLFYFGVGNGWHRHRALVSARCPEDDAEVLQGSRQKTRLPVGGWRPASPSVGDGLIVSSVHGSALWLGFVDLEQRKTRFATRGVFGAHFGDGFGCFGLVLGHV